MKAISRDWKPAGTTLVALLAIYYATLAPDLTFWDAGEFLSAIHSLGIPHPPGTPVYILVGNVWSHLFGPVFGFAKSVNLLSAVCTASGCAFLTDLFHRWTREPLMAFSAGICAGATSSLWLSATETEVYAPAFLVACVLLWVANQIAETGQPRWWLLFAYLVGLGWALHLTALVIVPGAIVLALDHKNPSAAIARVFRILPLLIICALIGSSAIFFMYFRAKHEPSINQGNPATIAALSDVIARRQYGSFSIWSRQAPLYLQFGNVFEWADWQFALGLDAKQPPSVLRTPVTLLFALLAIAGSMRHRIVHRASWRSLVTIVLTAYIGVVLYLNLKTGPSYGVGMLPASALHEARERDYFFVLVWVCWGLWAGFGSHVIMRRLFGRNGSTASAFGLVLAASPLVLNWRAVDRSREPVASEARALAVRILSTAPRGAVILAGGDNDTYPVWYLREVEHMRPDVTSITVPMLPAQWYRAELVRRSGLLPENLALTWQGTDSTLRGICSMARGQSRIVVGPLAVPDSVLKPAC